MPAIETTVALVRAAYDQLDRNVAENGKFFDAVAKRQGPTALTANGEIQTLAQAQGALGPAVRDGRTSLAGGDEET